jgi:hypothetical protein
VYGSRSGERYVLAGSGEDVPLGVVERRPAERPPREGSGVRLEVLPELPKLVLPKRAIVLATGSGRIEEARDRDAGRHAEFPSARHLVRRVALGAEGPRFAVQCFLCVCARTIAVRVAALHPRYDFRVAFPAARA